MADVAYTLQVGRQPFAHRRLFTANSVAEAVNTLQQKSYTPRQCLCRPPLP